MRECVNWIQVKSSTMRTTCRVTKGRRMSPLRRDKTNGNWKIGDWSVTTLGRNKRAYGRIQLVADGCWQSRMFNFYDQLPIKKN